jgi:hypothetical protein
MVPNRRTFLSAALASLAPEVVPQTENPAIVELPPAATLWGAAMFFTDDLVDLSVANGKAEKTVRGRFGGRRLVEHAWKNETSQTQRLLVRARAAQRELTARNIRYTAGEGIFAGFGYRPLPANPRDREGAYPYEVVFVGFILFD